MHDTASSLISQHLATTECETKIVESSFDTAHFIRANTYCSESIDMPEGIELPTLLIDSLRSRRSTDKFSGSSITLSILSTLISESAGITAQTDRYSATIPGLGPRSYPSGGALYPIELFIYPLNVEGLKKGFWYYQPLSNRLIPVSNENLYSDVIACFSNKTIAHAAALVLFFVDFSRVSLAKYGGKAYRLLLLEAGHLAQNLLLMGVSLNLAVLPVCGFADERLAQLAGLNFPTQSILYAVAIGNHIGTSHWQDESIPKS